MIRQATTPRAKLRFYNACRGKLCLGATMPLALELLGKSQPGRFFAGPTLALDIGGSTAWMAGHANPEELAGFLTFCGCGAVVLDEAEAAPPAGWTRARSHTIFGLTPGRQLPEPEADEALWASLTFDRDPPARPVAEALFPARPARRDDFYSELCTKRSRAGPASGRCGRGRRLPAPSGPMPLPMVRPTWPAGKRPNLCGAGASAGGSSSGWRTNSRQKASSLFSSAPPNGCTSIPASASKNWASMRAMKRPQSKIGGDIST